MNTWKNGLSIATLVAGLAGTASAQTCIEYDATLNTTPTAQGWEQIETPPFLLTVGDGRLHYSTLPYSNALCEGHDQHQTILWRHIDTEGISFDDHPVFEASVRVNDSQYGRNTCTDWPRPGFLMAIDDEAGHRFWIGLGNASVFLANDAYIPFGAPGVVEMAFDTTDDFHVYHLAVVGTTATLSIDGQEALTLSGLGEANVSPDLVAIGDGTTWANADVEIEWFRFLRDGCCPNDIDGSGAVDVTDLLDLLAAWGPCAGCPADLNGDDVVDVSDLLDLLAAWGPCI